MNPAYFHLFLVGWVTQMIFGVICWMFPIITRAQPQGNERLGWFSYILLNVGLLLRVIGEPLVSTAQKQGRLAVGDFCPAAVVGGCPICLSSLAAGKRENIAESNMPRLSQWIIRTAFIYLLLGFTFGGVAINP